MYARWFVALTAVLIFSCCAPLGSVGPPSSVHPLYTVRVTNQDWDAKAVRLYCDGRYVMTIRLVTGEMQTKRIRGQYCGNLRFTTINLGGDPIFHSPDILMSDGSVEITLAEYPVHTQWRTGVSRQTGT